MEEFRRFLRGEKILLNISEFEKGGQKHAGIGKIKNTNLFSVLANVRDLLHLQAVYKYLRIDYSI